MKKSKYCPLFLRILVQGTCYIFFAMYVTICNDGKHFFSFLFVFVSFWSLSSHSRIVHSYGVVTITGEGLQIVTMLGPHGHWAVGILQRAKPTVTSVNNGHLRGPMTLTHIAER